MNSVHGKMRKQYAICGQDTIQVDMDDCLVGTPSTGHRVESCYFFGPIFIRDVQRALNHQRRSAFQQALACELNMRFNEADRKVSAHVVYPDHQEHQAGLETNHVLDPIEHPGGSVTLDAKI